MKRTTDIESIKLGHPFTWGEVVAIHRIGGYEIVESHPWKTKGCEVLPGHPDKEAIRFHGWVDGKDTCHSFSSLEAAIVGCISYKHEGPNGRADCYFMKMIAPE